MNIWLFFDFFNYILFFLIELKLFGEYQFLFLEISRNYSLLTISGIYPLYISFYENKDSYSDLPLSIFTTKECARNFNILLLTEKTYNSFSKFLTNSSKDGIRILSLWTDLNVFKHNSFMKKKNVNLLSTDIFEKYIKEYSVYYIDIPGDIINKIEISYRNLNKDLYHPSFDELLEYLFNILKEDYFPNFKNSDDYKELENELQNEEIINSRLLGSSTISDIELI